MADPKKRLATNADGDFFVDSTCIDCDACRQIAPDVFRDDGEFSCVFRQPATDDQHRRATQALLACPTGSIGTVSANLSKMVRHDFPDHIEGGVYYCGFNSPLSFGGNSYFVRHPEGNWLIDSPKYLPFLVRQLESLGGIRYIFLTHRDDVAEAHRYAERFTAERIIHRYELSAQPGAEIVLEGRQPIPISSDIIIVPTFGHTRGHCVLLYRNRFLFTGDHLWWSRTRRTLAASRDYCWYSWDLQIESMARLLDCDFEWVLPGHGQRVQLPERVMREHLSALVLKMRSGTAADD